MSTQSTNKRARFASVISSKSKQKKRKELLYDDSDDDNDESQAVSTEKMSTEITGDYCPVKIYDTLPSFTFYFFLEIDRCAICLDDCTEPKQLDKCSHIFCRTCIDHYFETVKPQCPCCFTIYGEIRGIKFVFLL